MSAEDHNVFAPLEVRSNRQKKDIARFQNEERFQASKWFFRVSDHQFRDGGAKPAKRGFLTNARKSVLHPLEQSITASKVVNHAEGKPRHEDSSYDDNNGL
jgi:hypothetical protein